MYAAANETTIYLQQCQRSIEGPNKDLNKLWLATAAKVRGLDTDLYNRLQGKAEYWSNPESWSAAKMKNANLSLESIKATAREILRDK